MRVRLVLLYKEIPCEVREEKLRDWSDEFLKIRPYKPSVPVLIDEETVIVESAIIMEYLDEQKGPPLMPKDPLQRAQARMWIHWSAGEFRDAIQAYKYKEGEEKAKGQEQVEKCLERIDSALTSEYLQGPKPGLADFGVWPFVRQAMRVEPSTINYARFIKLNAWYLHIEQEPRLAGLMANSKSRI